MRPRRNPFHPPLIAVWLANLFAPAEQAESILGDMLEEFSQFASKSGVALARRWYWWQAVRTIADLIGAGFRAAPLLIAAAVIAGFLLIGFLTRFSQHAVQAFLDAHRIYESHPHAYLFWLLSPLTTGRVIFCGLIGALIALVVKGREMTVAATLAFVQIVPFIVGAFVVAFSRHHWVEWFFDMLPWNCACSVAIIVGGAIVRKLRSISSTPLSAT